MTAAKKSFVGVFVFIFCRTQESKSLHRRIRSARSSFFTFAIMNYGGGNSALTANDLNFHIPCDFHLPFHR